MATYNSYSRTPRQIINRYNAHSYLEDEDIALFDTTQIALSAYLPKLEDSSNKTYIIGNIGAGSSKDVTVYRHDTTTEVMTLAQGECAMVLNSGSTWDSTNAKASITSSSMTYLDAGSEQTVFEITASTTSRNFITGIRLNLTAITQNGTINLYSKISSGDYVLYETINFVVATDEDGLLLDVKIPLDGDFKLTYTEDADEGADRAIPYSYALIY